MSTDRARDGRFVWPDDWHLADCGYSGGNHLRAPENELGDKDRSQIRALVVGLNPGPREMDARRYFVGRAGQYLASSAYAPLWDECGPSGEILVTNIVKIVTSDALALKHLDASVVAACVAGCFASELRDLPHLENVYLLGAEATELFQLHAWRHLAKRVNVHGLRHPSHASTVPNLNELLIKGMKQTLQRAA